jgi:uncharacterized membrane protein YsdA (DUF1294 family)
MMPATLSPVSILVIYTLVNGFVFLLFLNDKRRAQEGAWRIKENILLLCAFFGPFGAYGAMSLLRHKTKKLKFYLVPLFLLLHTGLIISAVIPKVTGVVI